MEVVIGVPCMQKVDFYFVNSLIGLEKPMDSGYCLLANSLVYDARESIVNIAHDHHAEYVLWLDSDMTFPSNIYYRLKEHIDKGEADIVSGLYFARLAPYDPVIFTDIKLGPHWEIENKGHKIYDYRKSPFFEIDGCGMGCCLMKMEVLEKMAEEYGTLFSPLPSISEDISFCQRAKRLGFKIGCDSTVECGHIGWSIVNSQTFETYNNIPRILPEELVKIREKDSGEVGCPVMLGMPPKKG